MAHHPKRGSCAVQDIGVLPGVRGTLIHDGLLSYKRLRELRYIHEDLKEHAFDGWAGLGRWGRCCARPTLKWRRKTHKTHKTPPLLPERVPFTNDLAEQALRKVT